MYQLLFCLTSSHKRQKQQQQNAVQSVCDVCVLDWEGILVFANASSSTALVL